MLSVMVWCECEDGEDVMRDDGVVVKCVRVDDVVSDGCVVVEVVVDWFGRCVCVGDWLEV